MSDFETPLWDSPGSGMDTWPYDDEAPAAPPSAAPAPAPRVSPDFASLFSDEAALEGRPSASAVPAASRPAQPSAMRPAAVPPARAPRPVPQIRASSMPSAQAGQPRAVYPPAQRPPSQVAYPSQARPAVRGVPPRPVARPVQQAGPPASSMTSAGYASLLQAQGGSSAPSSPVGANPPRRAAKSRGASVMGGLVAVIVAAAVGSGYIPQLLNHDTSANTSNSSTNTGTSNSGANTGTSGLPAAVNAAIANDIVAIGVDGPNIQRGTGAVVGADGTVVTAYDFVAGSTAISVSTPSGARSAHLVGFDVTRNLAVLSVPGFTPRAAAFATTPPKTGDPVVVATTGISGTVRAAAQVETSNVSAGPMILLGANLNYLSTLANVFQVGPVTSTQATSGAIFNAKGQIVGIVVASEGVGTSAAFDVYAVPAAATQQIVSAVKAGKGSSSTHVGAPGYLGLTVQDLGNNNSYYPQVTAVDSGGPAAKAGIKVGDALAGVGSANLSIGATGQAGIGFEGVVRTLKPGSSVKVQWSSPSGATHTATLKVEASPTN